MTYWIRPHFMAPPTSTWRSAGLRASASGKSRGGPVDPRRRPGHPERLGALEPIVDAAGRALGHLSPPGLPEHRAAASDRGDRKPHRGRRRRQGGLRAVPRKGLHQVPRGRDLPTREPLLGLPVVRDARCSSASGASWPVSASGGSAVASPELATRGTRDTPRSPLAAPHRCNTRPGRARAGSRPDPRSTPTSSRRARPRRRR